MGTKGTPVRRAVAIGIIFTFVAGAATGVARTVAPRFPVGARHLKSLGSVDVARLAAESAPKKPWVRHYAILPEHDLHPSVRAAADVGGSRAPASRVYVGGGGGSGFKGVGILEMEKAGTGSYAGTNGGLEPPDQALCVGNGYVLEGVNTSWKVFTTRGAPVTPAIPITQFFKIAPAGQAIPPSSFVSDPRCVFDPQTKRFFALTLEADESSGVTQVPFTRSHTYFAVSKTGNPAGAWWVYSFDVTDDGLQGTPLHPSCPCISDQPLMGLDRYGFYVSGNEFSNSEIVPVPLPPAANGNLNKIFGTLPDYRNGQAQVYALAKDALVHGVTPPVWSYDTADVPVPAQDQGKSPASIWSSLQPASSPPGDRTPTPPGGAEYFMSQMDFQYTGDNRIAVWALTNTSSIARAKPAFTHKVISTPNLRDTYTAPVFGVDQKDGPHPAGDGCGCPEEQIAGNDDRMNQVMLTNGTLWSAVNTALPPAVPGASGKVGNRRVGIMYFQVRPKVDGRGNLTASMVRDGYVQIARSNVLFPSIAASPAGPVAMFFSIAGMDYYPSAAWTRLDALRSGEAPTIHISGAGAAPEDGFTGYPITNELGIVPLDPDQGTGVARWGDYTAAAVDESGCLWGAAEYIPGGARDPQVNWGTFVTRVQPGNCAAATLVAASPGSRLHINPCGAIFADPAGDDELDAVVTPAPSTKGRNPQMDIVRGDIRVSSDGKTLSTILTLTNLTKTSPQGGQANTYYFYWQYAGKAYYSEAQVDGITGDVTYADGIINSSGLRAERAATDTGSLRLGPHGTVTVNVPASVIGNPHSGSVLAGINAETRELEAVALVLQYDATTSQFDYQVGAVCRR